MTSIRLPFLNHVLPTSCLFCFTTQHFVLHGQQPFHTHRVPRFFGLASCSHSFTKYGQNDNKVRTRKIRPCVRRKVRVEQTEELVSTVDNELA